MAALSEWAPLHRVYELANRSGLTLIGLSVREGKPGVECRRTRGHSDSANFGYAKMTRNVSESRSRLKMLNIVADIR